jgi:hypothetical protein
MAMTARSWIPFGSLYAVVIALGLGAGAWGQPTARGGAVRQSQRSDLIYPPERIKLRVNHAHPAHRRLKCVRCHEDAGKSRKTADNLNPTESSCLPCHEKRIDRENRSQENCSFCHEDYGKASPRHVPSSEFPDARLKFSHAAHVRFGDMMCLECHRGVDAADTATRQHLPTMRNCFRCHGGADPKAPTDCNTCHITRPDGKLRTHWPGGWMNPKPWLHDMNHDADWIVRHRWVAADQGDTCASCHRERDCVECHDGRVRPQRVHPNDYLTIHAQMARRNNPQCTSCHSTQTFCNECHSRLGVSQISAPRVRAAGRFHPPASVWVRGPVQHAREARRSMNTCTSCHAEQDCVRCHGELGIGSGISPHPPGFANNCGGLIERNPRACRSCHGDLAALKRRCQ